MPKLAQILCFLPFAGVLALSISPELIDAALDTPVQPEKNYGTGGPDDFEVLFGRAIEVEHAFCTSCLIAIGDFNDPRASQNPEGGDLTVVMRETMVRFCSSISFISYSLSLLSYARHDHGLWVIS